MAEQTHILVTTKKQDDAEILAQQAAALKKARLGDISFVTNDEAHAEALKKAKLQAVFQPELDGRDLFKGLSKSAVEACPRADIAIVIPAAVLGTFNVEDLRATRTIFWHEWARIAVFGRPIFEEADKNNTANIKVVAGKDHRIHYMSRGATPYGADVMVADTGIWALRLGSLKELAEAEPTALERTEKIPLLRALENEVGMYMSLIPSSV